LVETYQAPNAVRPKAMIKPTDTYSGSFMNSLQKALRAELESRK
jgi:hypothetical protein